MAASLPAAFEPTAFDNASFLVTGVGGGGEGGGGYYTKKRRDEQARMMAYLAEQRAEDERKRANAVSLIAAYREHLTQEEEDLLMNGDL